MRPLAALAVALLACGGGSSQDDAAVTDDSGATAPDAYAGPDAAQPTCTPTSGTSIGLQEVASGLTQPLFLTSPPGDKRLFVLEQAGRIRIIKDGALLPTPFLDITDTVWDIENEQGLLGLAFHPDFRSNGRFFVNYTAESPETDTVIAEYRVSGSNPDLADGSSEKRLLVIQQDRRNHNGGMIAFAPDGTLWIGMGDGGGSGDPDENAQDPKTLLGAMLRIDVDAGDPYAIPADNPYADSANGAGDPRPEIWALGVRNPWRWSFDPPGGNVYIADVGQNLLEEINVAPIASAGLNYGWDDMEGSDCFEPASGCITAGHQLPIAEYQHVGAGRCSVTGGYVYRGSCLPDIQGWYLYADYCTGEIWKLEYPGDTTPVNLASELGNVGRISSFGQDATGELYVTALQSGTVYKIVAD